MMTGIPIENRIWLAYLLAAFFIEAGFAIYDIHTRRVPNRALVFFYAFAALSPVLRFYFALIQELSWTAALLAAAESLLGGVLGLVILLAAAMLSKDGSGIGGGDIKLCAALGIIYGPSGMALILLVASALAMPVILIVRRFCHDRQPPAIPFVPFLVCGCSLAMAAQIIL